MILYDLIWFLYDFIWFLYVLNYNYFSIMNIIIIIFKIINLININIFINIIINIITSIIITMRALGGACGRHVPMTPFF